MAAEIKEIFNVEPQLIEGRNGVFDVQVDGKLIFSKHSVGRFPENHEVLDQIEALRG